jgi:hypothetical protein
VENQCFENAILQAAQKCSYKALPYISLHNLNASAEFVDVRGILLKKWTTLVPMIID